MPIETVLSYLKAAASSEEGREAALAAPGGFVTISRQAGAGAAPLAKKIASRLSAEDGRPWHVFDRELCETVAADEKLSVSIETLMREVYRSTFEDYMAQFILDDSPQAAVVKRMFEVVRAAATAGRAVIIGRAGALVTRGLAGGVHIRLVAPKAVRLSRMAKHLGLTPKQAEREAELQDASRRRLIKDYFGRDIDDPLLYDAVWNASTVSVESLSSIIGTLVQERRKPIPAKEAV